MAEIKDVFYVLVDKGVEKGFLSAKGEEVIPEELLAQESKVCEGIYHGVSEFCKWNDQISMVPTLTIQLGGHAGIGAAALYKDGLLDAPDADILSLLTEGHDVMELGTLAWEKTKSEPGSEWANAVDDHINGSYMKALIEACDGNGGNMNQENILHAAAAMYRYGALLELKNNN